MTSFVVRLFIKLALGLLIQNALCYEPTWDSLDSRPLPGWYDEAKLGIFIHWGVFSVPSFSSEWFWWKWQGQQNPRVVEFMAANYKPDFTYSDFAKDFTAEFFVASDWAELFQSSGAKYIVFVSKHHEGFTNWPSKHSFNWNSVAVGPNRDIVGELMNATRGKTDLRFGLYHSLFEWFNPLYLADKKSGFVTQDFVNQKTLPELYELVNTYKPDVVWSDGAWEATDTYWKSKEFLAWLYTDSPVKDTVVVNDRWGINISCHHGGVYTCGDRYNPGVLQKHKWVNAMTIDRGSWGFRRNAVLSDYLTIEELLQTFITTVSCGGNMLMNVGPPSHGHITPIYEERLRQMGSWLKVNGEGIYSSKPWTYQNDTLTNDVWYTAKSSSSGTNVYAFIFNWPSTPVLSLGLPQTSSATVISLLGYQENFSYNTRQPAGVDILIPAIPFAKLPCQWICGGNMLMNVGPPSHGHITPIYEERLRQMGSWLKVNGEGIYSSKPWTYQNDTLTNDVWYTAKSSSSGTNVYAFIFNWPSTPVLSLGLPQTSSATVISLLGYQENFSYNTRQPAGVDILIPAIPFAKLPCQWMWVFKITAVEN